MRVISGTYRSRVLKAPPGLSTRPTSDRLRETLFNVLAPRMNGSHVVDLYAGSGAVGIEAISRGAARVVFVERAEAALAVLRNNLETLGLRATAQVRAVSVSTFLNRKSNDSYDLLFLDPPYDAAEEYTRTLGLLGGASHSYLAENAVVVAEHRRKEKLEETYGALRRTRLLEQGDAALSFYSIADHP